MTAEESADHGHDKAIQIVINGRKRTVEAKELSFKGPRRRRDRRRATGGLVQPRVADGHDRAG